MPRFLIEVPHASDTVTCARAAQVFLTTGSHFLTHADWGCLDGVHSAFLTVEVDSKDEARGILPPAFRAAAKITHVVHFKLPHVEETLRKHGALE